MVQRPLFIIINRRSGITSHTSHGHKTGTKSSGRCYMETMLRTIGTLEKGGQHPVPARGVRTLHARCPPLHLPPGSLKDDVDRLDRLGMQEELSEETVALVADLTDIDRTAELLLWLLGGKKVMRHMCMVVNIWI